MQTLDPRWTPAPGRSGEGRLADARLVLVFGEHAHFRGAACFTELRARCPMALLLTDLDHFREINDTLGHLIGDDLLVEAARRISACTRETDTVARLGGDEFTTILTRVNDARHVEAISQKIPDRLAEPFQLRDSVVHGSASLGITLHPQAATEVADLLKSADQAMYEAERQGRNRFSHLTQGCRPRRRNACAPSANCARACGRSSSTCISSRSSTASPGGSARPRPCSAGTTRCAA